MPKKPAEISILTFSNSCSGLARDLPSTAWISQAFNPSEIPTHLHPPLKKHDAIWDTGATGTVITQKVIDECNLSPISMTFVETVSEGREISPVYLVNIKLPNEFGLYNLRVVRGNVGGKADVLIGMDVITQGDFAVTNMGGKTTFSFRVPSCECIDFTVQPPPGAILAPREMRKVGRNDPCPCGSGKKYKNCCGK